MGNGNPVSGHTNKNLTVTTATNADGLTDGEHIISPTLTNMIEGIHGNGIVMYDDTSVGEGSRNKPHELPGAVNYTSDTSFTVQGGYAVLDGIMYQFAGGVGATTTYTLNTSSASAAGSPSALDDTAGTGGAKEALVVVYVSADNTAAVKNIYWELGTASPIGTNSYPATPKSFLNIPIATGTASENYLSNKQTVVLAVLRVVYDAGGDDLKLEITEVNDKRVFVRPSPMYFSPITSGDVASTNELLDLDAFHSGVGTGALEASRFGAMWQSFGAAVTGGTVPDDNKDVLYYSGTHAARYTRSVFDRVLTSTAENITLKSTDANILLLTPSGNAIVTTGGSFPAGYIIEIRNLHASHTVAFVRASSYSIAGGTLTRFVCTTSHADTPVFSVLSDDSIETVQLADNAVTLAKMAGIARGKIIVGDASGNPSVLAAGANGKLLVADANGDPSWTTVSGDATLSAGALTIAANAVEGSMLNTNAISGQTEMTGDVADADEFLVSDAGTLKRADFSVVRDAVFGDVSGDATIADGGALTIASTAIQDGMLHDDVATGLAGAGTTATSGVINVIGGNGITANANDVAITAAQTTITSVTNAGLTVGRDAHNQIQFSTDNEIHFKTNNETPVIKMKASGEIEATKFDGALEGNADTATILATARAINGVDFDGSAAITVTAAGSTLSDTVTVAKGGTGATSLTDGGVLLGSGTGAVTAMAVLTDGQMIVGDGTTDPVAESGATLRTSIGVGTGDTVQFTGINLGHATDTTIARASAGDVSIEGNIIYRAGGTDVASDDIADSAITLPKMANMATSRVLGRISSNAGVPEVLTAANIRTILGVADGSLTTNDFTNADHSKLNGIEASATIDQTASEILTLIEDGVDSVHYKDGSIDAEHLAADAVTTAKILNANVTTAKIAADAVTSAKIADDAVDTEHIADDAIEEEHIGDGEVKTAAIGDEQVTLAKLAHAAANTVLVRDANSAGDPSFKAVTNTQILIGDGTGFTAAALSGDATMTNAGVVAIGNDKITADMIGDNVINSEHYAAASIDNEHLADNAVDSDEIAADAVITAKILDANVTLAKMANIADDTMLGNISGSAAAPAAMSIANVHTLIGEATGSITGLMSTAHHDKLDAIAASANNYVHPNHSGDVTSTADGATVIGNNKVITAKILNANVTTAKIADDAVTADKLASDAVVNASVAAGAAITFAKLEPLDSTKILVGNGSNVATEVAVSGDVTMANTGAITIGNDKIDSQHYAAGSIDMEHLSTAVTVPQHLRVHLIDNGLAEQSDGTSFFLQFADSNDYTSTGNTTDIVITDASPDYIELSAGGLYQVVVSVEMFTASGTAAQDFWLQLGHNNTNDAGRRYWGTARRKVKASSGSSDTAWNAQKTVIIDVPSSGDEKLYVSARVAGSAFTVKAYDASRTNVTVTKIGVSSS